MNTLNRNLTNNLRNRPNSVPVNLNQNQGNTNMANNELNNQRNNNPNKHMMNNNRPVDPRNGNKSPRPMQLNPNHIKDLNFVNKQGRDASFVKMLKTDQNPNGISSNNQADNLFNIGKAKKDAKEQKFRAMKFSDNPIGNQDLLPTNLNKRTNKFDSTFEEGTTTRFETARNTHINTTNHQTNLNYNNQDKNALKSMFLQNYK